MEKDSPTPKPRPNPSSPARTSPLKKPIPLPRFKKRRESVEKNEFDNTDTLDGSPKQSVTQMLKDEFKSASDNVQEKSKLVMQSTRRLALNMMPKRFTTQQEYNGKDNPLLAGALTDRCQSLPSDDIFRSISFDSPLTPSHDVKVNFEETDLQDSCDSPVEYYPPPQYPPPPLPDELIYDEVSSVKSSHSGSQQDPSPSDVDSYQDIDGIYEELSNARSEAQKLNEEQDPQVSSMSTFQCSDTESVSLSVNNLSTQKKFTRSESWTFYDTVSCSQGESGLGESASNIYNEDPVAASSARKVACSSSPSFCSELDALAISSDDIGSNVSCGQSSPAGSSATSFSTGSYQSAGHSSDSTPEGLQVEMRKKVNTSSQKLPSKSVIFEFDPLYENLPTAEHLAKSNLTENDLMILAGLAPAKETKTSNYGKVNVKRKEGGNMVTVEEENDPPPRAPTPPERFDSMSLTSTEITEPRGGEERAIDVPNDETSVSLSRKSSLSQHDADSNPKRFSYLRQHWPSIKRVLKPPYHRESRVLPTEVDSSAERSSSAFYANISIAKTLEKPSLEPMLAVQYNGSVYKGSNSSRDLALRWCHLAESQLVCTADKTGSGNKEVIPLDSVLSIQLALEHRTGSEGEEIHCFELSVAGKNRNAVFGVTSSMERRVWMQKILENFTTAFPTRIAADYSRFGWCFFKEGIGGSWTPAWLLLYKRNLMYCVPKGKLNEADLRKARSIVIQEPDSVFPVILIDFPKLSLYLRTERTSETSAWRNAIRGAATDNGPDLENQQLTQENVPVLVEKCINFVYAHGSLAEGIYRRSGANSSVTKLLTMFRKDAWAVQLSRQEFSEYDVASVLKRFFRDLPEPLLTAKLHSKLCETSAEQSEEKRLAKYHSLLAELPSVNAVTLRRLLAHLHFIHEESEHNLMPVENLAAIWGPTLMHVENGDEITWSRQESKVIVDLVYLFPRLYVVDAEELSRDKRIREVLQRLHAGKVHPQQAKPTGDLRVWIHIGSKDSGKVVHVTVGPQKSCHEVCSELASHLSLHAHQATLCEVVLNGALKRYLHHSEKVLDSVLRWGYWDEPDRSNNYLVLVANTIFQELSSIITPPITMSGELRFADQKSKSFKAFPFEFSQAKLCYYKDKRGANKIAEWPVEDIIWYEGFEPKRNPNSRWAITFINKGNKAKRSKESPYFGCTMAGTSKEDQNKWMAALLAAEYPQGLLPPPIQVNLLE
ncbi:Arf-GAP with Rho-GAP domain, ANK repeat and PH domain-containing protein 2 [Frankliniella fusca]|uniref:Arf-GAP with Rho-GAP domain, ANK repeat and PH domain-containing protein 2 n=1 Tax=Frankliniella fusca TaxID=407009 RepID=A0AAE1L8X9_9NEOP|nr:Arf-GAP with Rho-GAP domain, ANK repeat and PH domain-containing protein 2 [Frankliniella fusca]